MLEDDSRSPRATVIAALLCGGGPQARSEGRRAWRGKDGAKGIVYPTKGIALNAIKRALMQGAGPCRRCRGPATHRPAPGWRKGGSFALTRTPARPYGTGRAGVNVASGGSVRHPWRTLPPKSSVCAIRRRVSGGQVHASMLQILRRLRQRPGLMARERGWACSNKAIIQMGKPQRVAATFR